MLRWNFTARPARLIAGLSSHKTRDWRSSVYSCSEPGRIRIFEGALCTFDACEARKRRTRGEHNSPRSAPPRVSRPILFTTGARINGASSA